MNASESVIGVILAGGRSTRMGGGDKCLRTLAGRPLLSHAVERLGPQVSGLIVNANGEASRFAPFGLPVVPDSFGGFAGPLAGIHAGLAWTAANRPGTSHIVTMASDTPFFPTDLVRRFLAAAAHDGALRVARSEAGLHPVIGLWPVSIAADLETSLGQGARKARAWVEQQGAVEVFFPKVEIGGRPIDPFFNVNRPEDLAEAEALLTPRA